MKIALMSLVVASTLITACHPSNHSKRPVIRDSENDRYNVVQMSQTVKKEIVNDTLEVVLSIDSKKQNRQEAMNEVSEKLNEAMKQIKADSEFEAQLLSRNGHEYTENLDNAKDEKGEKLYTKLWQESAQILVKSKNFDKLNQLVSKVQSLASINSMSFTSSDDSVKTLETELTKEGIKKFNERANLIAKEFGGKSYKIVAINVGNIDMPVYPVYRNFKADRQMAMQESSAVAVNDSLPGQKVINLFISGSIEIVQ